MLEPTNYETDYRGCIMDHLPCNDLGFGSRWGRCKNRASRPSQGTVNNLAVDGTLNTTNQQMTDYVKITGLLPFINDI